MYCINCGTELPGEAYFCLQCGKARKDAVKEGEAQWETCKIVWERTRAARFIGLDTGQFWAKASGPNGSFSAGRSEKFKGKLNKGPRYGNEESVKAWTDLIAKLSETGWEITQDQGSRWYSCKFRRPVKK